MAIPFGKMIKCIVVVSPDERGYAVIEAKGRQAERQLAKRGWTQKRSIWLAPFGWKESATVIFPWEPSRGEMLHGFRFYDTESERNVTICTNNDSEHDQKHAEVVIRRMGWRRFRGQWRAPRN